MYIRNRLKGFTLVELIVVITIVGILSTVGFVSYSGYLTGARDSNRFSQLTKLSDSLQTYAASKSLPLPDDYIEITASGATNVIAYQGYVGVDVLETIDYTNGGKDPKDDSYYTYYLTKDRKKLQLLALMEEGSSAQAYMPNSTYAVDYSERFPRTYGNKLGVLTDSLNNPVQEISSLQTLGYLDVFNTTDEYVSYFGDSGSITGDGDVLGLAILGEGRIIGAWSLESIAGGSILDISGNGNNGVLSGSPAAVLTTGVSGNGIDFSSTNGTAGSVIEIPINETLGTGAFSFSFWFQPNNQATTSKSGQIIKYYTDDSGSRSFTFLWNALTTDDYKQCRLIGNSGTAYKVPIQSTVDINVWNHVVCSFDGEKLSTYLNGVLENSMQVNEPVNNGNVKMKIGAGGPDVTPSNHFFDGKIDEVSFYKKGFTSEEVRELYEFTK